MDIFLGILLVLFLVLIFPAYGILKILCIVAVVALVVALCARLR